MVAQLKLIGAIMVTLFAMGFEAEAALTKMYWMCQELNSKLSSTPGSDQLSSDELISLAKSHISWYDGMFVGDKLFEAWATVVRGSDCGESSLENVLTIADCSPGKGFGILNDATKKYAQKCLTREFWRDRIEKNQKKPERIGCLPIGCSKGEDQETEFIDEQYLLDFRQEQKNCEGAKIGKVTVQCTESALRKSLSNAVVRDLKVDFKKLKSFNDVDEYLEKRLYKPCSNLNLSATSTTLKQIEALERYIGTYDEVVNSLDESAQVNIVRYATCLDVKIARKRQVTRMVLHGLADLRKKL